MGEEVLEYIKNSDFRVAEVNLSGVDYDMVAIKKIYPGEHLFIEIKRCPIGNRMNFYKAPECSRPSTREMLKFYVFVNSVNEFKDMVTYLVLKF